MNPEPMIGEEDVARALYDETLRDHLECGGQPLKTDWDTQPAVAKAFSYRVARAAISAHLAALERAGLVVVPREPAEPIACNLPFERVPQCACDPGSGPPPTKTQMLECRLRGGPCAPPPQNSDEVKPEFASDKR